MKRLIVLIVCIAAIGCATTPPRQEFTVPRDQEQESWDRANSFVIRYDGYNFRQQNDSIIAGDQVIIVRERGKDSIRYICYYTGTDYYNPLSLVESYIRYGDVSTGSDLRMRTYVGDVDRVHAAVMKFVLNYRYPVDGQNNLRNLVVTGYKMMDGDKTRQRITFSIQSQGAHETRVSLTLFREVREMDRWVETIPNQQESEGIYRIILDEIGKNMGS